MIKKIGSIILIGIFSLLLLYLYSTKNKMHYEFSTIDSYKQNIQKIIGND